MIAARCQVSYISRIFRICFILFLTAAGITYCKLWNHYIAETDTPTHDLCGMCSDILHMGDEDHGELQSHSIFSL